MISEQDVQAYHRDGVIVVPEVLDAATLAEVRQVIAELVAGAAEVTEHTDVYDLEPGHTPRKSPGPPHQDPAQGASDLRRDRAQRAGHRHPDEADRSRIAAARLQAQHEVGALRLAGGMASGLGVLSAHQ